MDNIISDYLDKVDKYLKSMPAIERADIVNEIKSQMFEHMAEQGISPEQTVSKMGNPKDLAKAYLGESISKNNTFSLRKFVTLFKFYSFAGIGSLFVLPISVLSVGLMICSVISPVGGLIKFIGYLFGYDVPFVKFQVGSYTAHPLLFLPLSIIFGFLFYFAGKGLWYLTVKFIRTISNKKRSMQNL